MDCGVWFADAFCIGTRGTSSNNNPAPTNNTTKPPGGSGTLGVTRESSTEFSLLNSPIYGSDHLITNTASSHELTMKLKLRIQDLEERIRQRRTSLQAQQQQQRAPLPTYANLMEHGKEAFKQANFEDAGNMFDLARRQCNGNVMEAARAEANLGNVCYALLKYHAALHHYQTAITLFRSINEPGFECAVLENAMETCIKLQRFELALGYATRKTGLEMINQHPQDTQTKAKAQWLLSQITTAGADDDL